LRLGLLRLVTIQMSRIVCKAIIRSSWDWYFRIKHTIDQLLQPSFIKSKEVEIFQRSYKVDVPSFVVDFPTYSLCWISKVFRLPNVVNPRAASTYFYLSWRQVNVCTLDVVELLMNMKLPHGNALSLFFDMMQHIVKLRIDCMIQVTHLSS